MDKIEVLIKKGLSVLDMSEMKVFKERWDSEKQKFDAIFFENLFDHPNEQQILGLLDVMKKQLNEEGKIIIQQQICSIDEMNELGKSHNLEIIRLAEKKLFFEKMERTAKSSTDSFLYWFSNSKEAYGEKIRYFDEQLFVKGVDQKRVIHKNGDWHETVHAYFFYEEYLLIQKRTVNKHDFPDCFDMSTAGHIQYFESAEVAFKREIKEELGVFCDILLKEYRSFGYLKDEIISKSIDREIAWIYVGELEPEGMEQIVLCEDEVAELYFVRISDFVQMWRDHLVTEIQLFDRSFQCLSEKMTQTDYLPHQKEYLIQVAEILDGVI